MTLRIVVQLSRSTVRLPSKRQHMKQQTKAQTGPKTASPNPMEPERYALFRDAVCDLYWAENHLVKMLPKMIASASSKALKNAITKHLSETKGHVNRLEKIFEELGEKAIAKKCDAMEGLAKEGEAVIETTPDGTRARDTGIIFAAQKVEHYEIASYTGAHLLASTLGFNSVATLLQETLTEEQRTDKLLSEMVTNTLKGKPKKA